MGLEGDDGALSGRQRAEIPHGPERPSASARSPEEVGARGCRPVPCHSDRRSMREASSWCMEEVANCPPSRLRSGGHS